MNPRSRLALALIATGACSGTIGAGAPDPGADATWEGARPAAPAAGRPGASPAAGPGASVGGGRLTPAPNSGISPPAAPGAAAGCGAPAPGLIRRLTRREYRRTVRDLLGFEQDVTSSFPDEPALRGFDNSAETLAISPSGARGFLEAAERLGDLVRASTDKRQALLGCDPAGASRAVCLRAFVARFGARAFRRPLMEAEVTRLLAVGDTAGPGAEPLEVAARVVEAALQSPKFLFRIEIGKAAPTRPGLLALSGHEMATRLGYLLLGSMPDDGLRAAATAGTLDSPEGIRRVVEGLLAEERGRVGLQSFHAQWLRASDVSTLERDAMAEESLRFVNGVLWNTSGVSKGSMLDLLSSRQTFVNPPLAALYRVPAPPAGKWAASELGPERSGVLTQASFLAATGAHDATPIVRGKVLREVFLCETLPPPPPDAPVLPPKTDDSLSQREILDRHRKDPACNGCHALLEPLGYGLARFDEIGAYVGERDARGRALSQKGSLTGEAQPDFDGPVELAARLAASPRTASCAVEQLFRYAHGRLTGEADACALGESTRAFTAGGHSFQAVLLALVTADSFRFLSASSTPGPTTGGAP